jgi:site-specific recombinase XerD
MSEKLNVIHALEIALTTNFSSEQIHMVSDTLTKVLSDYNVTKQCTDIVIGESVNERLIRQYCACLFVDGKSEKTTYQYRRTCIRLSNFINKPFTQIGAYDIRYFLAMEKSRGLSNHTIETIRANLSAFFQWLLREELIDKNPCFNIKPIKYTDTVKKAFSDIEIDAMRGACRTKKERALIELLLSTGIRVSELTHLKVQDINRTSLSVHIKHGKGDKERITYTTNVAMRYLDEYLQSRKEEGAELFYNGKHKPLGVCGVRYILNMIANRANVTHVHPHRFRRTFASGLANRGMDVQMIQKLMGHADINVTMKYICIDDTHVRTSYNQCIT